MKGLSNVCVFCRHVTPLKSPTFVSKRNATFSKHEPYILPRLIIDLDDADSKFVRKAEDLEDKAPELDASSFRSGAQPIPPKEKLVLKRDTIGSSPKPSLVKVTPPDLLTYALVGDPEKRKPTSCRSTGKRLGHIFACHSIHPSESVETKVHIMTRNTLRNTKTHFSLENFDESRHPAILEYMESCQGLGKIRQLVSLLCLTDNGCQFLADNGASVAKVLRSCPRSQYPDVIIFLNNLVHKMNSNGVEIGRSLCNAGLYYSCETHNLPATKMYLEIIDRNSYASGKNVYRALSALVAALVGFKRGEIQSRHGQFNVLEGLRLLTGPNIGDEQWSGKNQTTSFASLAQRDAEARIQYSLYASYILYLGKLGLVDHLQLEWKSSRIPFVLRRNDNMKPVLFAAAFLLASQQDKALAVLKSLAQSSRSDELKSCSSKSSQDTLANLVGMFYKMHRLDPSERLQSLMQANLSSVPEAPEDMLALLEFFLNISDAPTFEQVDGKSDLKIDCVEIDGGACLFVLPRRGGSSKTLYSKSSSLKPGLLKFD